MSDSYDEIIRNFNIFNVSLNDDSPKQHGKPTMPGPSCFSPKSVSSEKLIEDAFDCSFDIWSENVAKKAPYPFRVDRSMSLTDNYLPSFPNNKMKSLELPPPPGFPPLAPQASNRYKTELCRSFQENGSCKYGNKCQFAHGESELRGLYRHPKYKTEACRTFYNFGYCPYGSRCHFIHEEKLSVCSQTLNQKTQAPGSQQARVLRQSVSFAGFSGSRSVSPPISYESMRFNRAPSVSPPPSDILSPAYNETSRDMFPFPQSRVQSEGHNRPLLIEPQKSSHCVWDQVSNFEPLASKCVGKENRSSPFRFSMQRFASDDSLSDHESYSSTGSSSGSESPTFENAASKRLTVFARMSVSE